ncbi:hypothetical protein LP419_20070 [Massilia sp. H-1]|nr:hypothetical protein LP419_20070 [Massilia sp. H-1]
MQALLLAEGHHLVCATRSPPASAHPRLSWLLSLTSPPTRNKPSGRRA